MRERESFITLKGERHDSLMCWRKEKDVRENDRASGRETIRERGETCGSLREKGRIRRVGK